MQTDTHSETATSQPIGAVPSIDEIDRLLQQGRAQQSLVIGRILRRVFRF